MWNQSNMPRTNTTWSGFWMSFLSSHGVENCIWKTWCRLINVIRCLQTEDDCGCWRGFRTWYSLSCAMSHQYPFRFILLCTMSECFKIFKMCPTFVMIKIMSAGQWMYECDILSFPWCMSYKICLSLLKQHIITVPKWLMWTFSDLSPLWLRFG